MKSAFLSIIICMNSSYGQISSVEIQGHRGARGLLPENSIEGFVKAIELGVHTVELDVIISADQQVVVSHEPWLNPKICLDENGEQVTDKSKNLYKMDYPDIKKCDCGSLGNSNFPSQQPVKIHKPLLSEVIKESERAASMRGWEVKYNIELKSNPEGDGIHHPAPRDFSELVYEAIKELPRERVNIQSFDKRIIQTWHEMYPDFILAYLVANLKSWEKNIEELGFQPEIYSPNYRLINKKKVEQIHAMGMKVIPWTVNKEEDMKKCIEMGVDAIITDYPDIALKLVGER